jgi:hypothetical protein
VTYEHVRVNDFDVFHCGWEGVDDKVRPGHPADGVVEGDELGFATVTLSGGRLYAFAVIEHASRRIRLHMPGL